MNSSKKRVVSLPSYHPPTILVFYLSAYVALKRINLNQAYNLDVPLARSFVTKVDPHFDDINSLELLPSDEDQRGTWPDVELLQFYFYSSQYIYLVVVVVVIVGKYECLNKLKYPWSGIFIQRYNSEILTFGDTYQLALLGALKLAILALALQFLL